MKFFSESANEIWAFNNKELDWITSRVVLFEPLLYSATIPSLAISAASTCARTEFNKLWLDLYKDHALATSVWFFFNELSNNNLFWIS